MWKPQQRWERSETAHFFSTSIIRSRKKTELTELSTCSIRIIQLGGVGRFERLDEAQRSIFYLSRASRQSLALLLPVTPLHTWLIAARRGPDCEICCNRCCQTQTLPVQPSETGFRLLLDDQTTLHLKHILRPSVTWKPSLPKWTWTSLAFGFQAKYSIPSSRWSQTAYPS